jgi:hypothetical protein
MRILLAVSVALMLFGCTQAEPPQSAPTPTAQGTEFVTDVEARCSNEADVVTDEALRVEPTLEGDVDGDGVEDSMFVANDEDAETGCTSFLVVETVSRTFSIPIETTDVSSSLQVPSINSVAEVGGQPGSEIVVNVEAGASTQFVGLFTITDRGLERMRIRGFGVPESRDLFAFGGSVGHLDAVTCIASDIVIVSSAIPEVENGENYQVVRRFFLVRGTELTFDRGSVERHTTDGLDVSRFPEFARSPFVGCD